MGVLAKDVPAHSRLAVRIAIPLALLAVTGLVYWAFPQSGSCDPNREPLNLGYDWVCVFRPAIFALIHAQSPYNGLYFNPPWILLLLSPLAVLPARLGAAAIYVLCIAAFLTAAARLGMNRAALIFFLLNPFIWVVARQGNLDWIVAIGATLPPQIGLFLILTKPQAGIGIAIFWLVEALRQGSARGGIRSGIFQVLRVFAPVTLAYLLSFAIFGLWIIPPGWLISHQMNYSLWPFSIPIGLVLLAAALRGRNIRRAITASPFLSPYVLTMTWSLAFLGLKDWEVAAALVGTLVMQIIVPNFGLYAIHLMP